MVKVYKNLFGDNSKINASEIAVSQYLNLTDSVIVGIGSNSNGEWIRFGNGTQIVIGEVSAARTIDAVYDYDLPATFLRGHRIVGAINEASMGYTAMGDVWQLAPVFSVNRVRLTKRRDQENFRGSGNMQIVYFAIGKWR